MDLLNAVCGRESPRQFGIGLGTAVPIHQLARSTVAFVRVGPSLSAEANVWPGSRRVSGAAPKEKSLKIERIDDHLLQKSRFRRVRHGSLLIALQFPRDGPM
jgi:hypothetical protein